MHGVIWNSVKKLLEDFGKKNNQRQTDRQIDRKRDKDKEKRERERDRDRERERKRETNVFFVVQLIMDRNGS